MATFGWAVIPNSKIQKGHGSIGQGHLYCQEKMWTNSTWARNTLVYTRSATGGDLIEELDELLYRLLEKSKEQCQEQPKAGQVTEPASMQAWAWTRPCQFIASTVRSKNQDE